MSQLPKLKLWFEGSRPKTIPAALVPVLVGTASVETGLIAYRFLLALAVAIALQVGVNYANDYSDGIRGTDQDRVGPRRLVGSGLINAKHVKLAAGISFLIAAIAGLVLAIVTTLVLILIGCLAIIAAWFYTGGSKPYGYSGYGEISVFIFFGLIATVGSSYVQSQTIESISILCSVPVGFLASALLVVNNFRDIETDSETGKRTFAVRLGKAKTQMFFALLLLGSLGMYVLIAVFYTYLVLITLIVTPVILKLIYDMYSKESAQDLINILENTAKLHLLAGILLSIGLATGL
ncbi:MAG: 1,4-dihydroxy-2-naphthoate polyprenyltransferase [Acidimicrobiaceae bacterium]|jgi:1,4-dihydroxy-2-naphthoate octaprenyltransferase|nr:1,4-dihydroxy-2-naphthoate polyprenyltransferase [Acidimicrobiaceae bacterium]|tara:strand:- start:100581 stop:101459 length:879 start_codon:yes stop_codon:yes gene_type:complete